MIVTGTQFDPCNGYGRYTIKLAESLNAKLVLYDELDESCTETVIACMPGYRVKKLGGRQILYTMTEGSECPPSWIPRIKNANIRELIVPSKYNWQAFGAAGFYTHLVLGGTDHTEFPLVTRPPFAYGPYTFMALADRGDRKGWMEVWDAFFKYFPADIYPNVKLIVKARTQQQVNLLTILRTIQDERIEVITEDLPSLAELFKRIDCVVIPSHAEGWGMPHREAAISGIPTITLKYSGLDDGYSQYWALPIDSYILTSVPHDEHLSGQSAVVDVDALGQKMRQVYNNHLYFKRWAMTSARPWLINNQGWDKVGKNVIKCTGIK